MTEAAGSILRRLLAIVVLAVAVWLLFKVVIGVIASIAWAMAAVVSVVAVVWALRQL